MSATIYDNNDNKLFCLCETDREIYLFLQPDRDNVYTRTPFYDIK